MTKLNYVCYVPVDFQVGLLSQGTPQGGGSKASDVILTADIMVGVCWSLRPVEKGWPCRGLWGLALHIILWFFHRSCPQLGSRLPDWTVTHT